MSHNREHASMQVFALPNHTVLSLHGVDAVTFAQSQFMNDVTALEVGQWQWNGWLTPKGRVIALFAVLRVDTQTLWLLLPDIATTEIVPLLQRYVFRTKVALKSIETTVAASFCAPMQARDAAFAIFEDSSVELDMGGEAGARRLLIGGPPALEDHEAEGRWTQEDLAHGLPRLAASQREQWTPQQLSLERLRAYSVRKGCYPGQEIVARTHFLGQVKRGLSLYEAASKVVVGGDVVVGADRSIGKIICTAGATALAVVPLDAPTEDLSCGGIALKPMSLLGGLAR